VVLRGDFHPPALQVFHRLVGTPVAELEFERLSAKRLAEDLVA